MTPGWLRSFSQEKKKWDIEKAGWGKAPKDSFLLLYTPKLLCSDLLRSPIQTSMLSDTKSVSGAQNNPAKLLDVKQTVSSAKTYI